MKALAALTLGKKLSPPSRPSPIPVPSAQCDVLFEISSSSFGSVSLGRVLTGSDAGRLVSLRKLPGPASDELSSATDLGRSIAHPKLAKLLGIIRGREASYVASEYISGVTLFELGCAVVGRQASVNTAVAVRIVLDALQAAQATRQLLQETMGLRSVRCLYPECIWVADFGETFLSEVLVAPLLAPDQDEVQRASEADTDAETADVQCATRELVRLACGGLSSEDPLATNLASLPDELQELVARFAGHPLVTSHRSIEELSAALSGLDPSLMASEAQVSQELRRFMATMLTVRQQKLQMLERSSVQTGDDDEADETKFFRASPKTEERATTRPPPNSTSSIAPIRAEPVESVASAATSGARLARAQPVDDATVILVGFGARDGVSGIGLSQVGASDDPCAEAKLDSLLRSGRPDAGPPIRSLPASRSDDAAPAPHPARHPAPGSSKALLGLIGVLAVAASLRAVWLFEHGYLHPAAGAVRSEIQSFWQSARKHWR